MKIGDTLRDNVEHALELLGNELIQQNLDKIDLDKIDVNEFYAELLRIIYRIIFILYAEQRDMLPGAGSLYFQQFSLSSLRIRAEKPIKAEKNYDLWNKMLITFNLVRDGNFLLGVNSYNGSLFKEDNLRIILKNGMKISNDIVLKVIRLLTTSANHKVRQRINFLEVSEEEIGAIYESLLDFKPFISSSLQFQLIEGTERKSTGSYYTPKALIDILIRTTLQPLVEDRLEKAGEDLKEKKKAILEIKVCDPACGGGTFLLAALDYLGKFLAEVRTGTDSPLEDDLREARRDVLQHCIYGVDMNPLAVELAKISLWLRVSVKDKPLNFLDNHIKCGNSLIGLGQKMEINEISPNAFEAISENKATGIPSENNKLKNKARDVIKQEINERKKNGKTTLITSYFTERRTADICSTKFREIIDMPETDPHKIKEKEQKYEDLRLNENYQQALNEAHIWTSTFFWPFEGDSLGEIPRYTTIEQLREKLLDPELNKLMEKILSIADENQFFHWFIEFPEVFSTERGGFDCILTNPPWDLIQFEEMPFFKDKSKIVTEAINKNERRNLIKSLSTKNPNLFKKYVNEWRKIKKINHYFRNSNLYNLTAVGKKLNKYSIFAGRVWNLISPKGQVGIITPTGVATNYFMQNFFKALVNNNALLSMFDFKNELKLFKIDSRIHFSLLTLGGSDLKVKHIPMAFYCIDPIEIQKDLDVLYNILKKNSDAKLHLPEDLSIFILNKDDFLLLNPNTLTCPVFRTKRDAELVKRIYKKSAIFLRRNSETEEIFTNPWNIRLMTSSFNISTNSDFFLTESDLISRNAKPNNFKLKGGIWIDKKENKYYPLYDGKMIWLFDHRYNSVEFAGAGKQRKATSIPITIEQHQDPLYLAIPMYWVDEDTIIERKQENYNFKWFFGFRDITNPVSERTFVGTIIPFCAVGNSLPLILFENNPRDKCLLFSNLSSIIFDYVVRQKLSGTHMNFYLLEQMPVLKKEDYNDKLKDKIISKYLELVYTSYDLAYFAKDCGFKGDPYKWDEKVRNNLKAEIDAIYAIIYGLKKKELEFIIDSYDQLKRYEIKKFNEFQTKKLVLKAYDKYSKQKELFE